MSSSIEIRDLTKKFSAVTALEGVTLSFDSGILHGLIGPEGAGKTTLLRHIVGLYTPTSGDVVFKKDGKLIPPDTMKNSISYMPQSQSLYPDLSIDEHLDFFSELYGLARNEYLSKVENLLDITRLKNFRDRPAGKLSGGMYKKLGLMISLLHSPQILLLDEPTNGVDPIARREFWDLLHHLITPDIIIIYTTAYMDEAERCDRVHLFDSGKLFSSGVPSRLLEKAQVQNFDEFYLHQTRSSL